MAKSLRCKPSVVVGIKNEFVAYAFDAAVTRWGTSFDAAVEEAGRSAKTTAEGERAVARVLRRWIPSQRKYAEVKR